MGKEYLIQEKPLKALLVFALPMIIGNLFQQFYTMVDSVVVGRFVGEQALAAVGASYSLTTVFISIAIGGGVGASVITSQYFGAREYGKMKSSVRTALTAFVVLSVVLGGFGLLFSHQIMVWLNTPQAALEQAAKYLRIYFLGLPFLFMYNILSSMFNALGKSRIPLYLLIFSSVFNMILDVILVRSAGMGVAGVALATVIAQVISAVLCVFKLRKMTDLFDMKLKYLKPNKGNLMTVLNLGLPSGITQAIFSLAMVVVQSLTNSFGEIVIAANVIIMRVDGFAMMPNFSFGTAMTTYAGQNVGARKLDRVKQGAKQGTWIAVGTSAAITGIIVLFGHLLMGIFTNTEELVNLSADMMKILAVGYIAMAVTQSLSGVMRGAGDTMTPMWISMITTVVIRVPLAYGIAAVTKTPQLPQGRYECIWISLLISWVLGAVMTVACYRMGRWKKTALGG